MSLLTNNVLQLNRHISLLASRSPIKSRLQTPWTCSRCLKQQRRHAYNAADSPGFTSIVDHPPQLVRVNRKHGYGIIILGILKPSSLSIPF